MKWVDHVRFALTNFEKGQGEADQKEHFYDWIEDSAEGPSSPASGIREHPRQQEV